MTSLKREPLAWLGELAASGEGARWAGPRLLCIADPASARAVLHNKQGDFVEHSDFFATKAGTFGPRDTQIALGRDARRLITDHLAGCDAERAADALDARSLWPRAGCALVARLCLPVLVGADRAPRFGELLREIVRVRILERGLARPRPIRALSRKWQFFRQLDRERARHSDDALAFVARHGEGASTAQLAEVYLGFVFSLISSIGLTLGWTLMLAVTERRTDAPVEALVREALRLYPIAWWLARRPARRLDLLGHAIGPTDTVVVSPYAVHRDPRHWPDPDGFRPERWAGQDDRTAWLPFGAGPHACIAMGLTFQLLGRLLPPLLSGSPAIDMLGRSAMIDTALAPPLFTLARGSA